MVKIIRKKLTSKSKPKIKASPKIDLPPVIAVEEPKAQEIPVLFKAETIPLEKPTETPLQSNNNLPTEAIETPVSEVILPKEEIVEQKESVAEFLPSVETIPTEQVDKPAFLEDKPSNNEEIITRDDKPKKPFLTFVIIFFAFLFGVFLGGFVVYKKSNIFMEKKSEPKEIVSEKQEQVSPSPTPKEELVDLSKYSIEILNGSGIKGAAGELKDTLSKEGFNITSTGNATSSSFTKSVVRAKKEVDKQYLKKLEDFLIKSYSLSETQELEDSKKTDLEIIMGTE